MNTNLKLVECTEEYWEFVRCLRNDPLVLDGFIESTHITPEMQKKYMSKYADCYRVCLNNNEPCGYVGVIEDDIRICTAPAYQGIGVGKFMVKHCMEIWPTAFAKIKIGNTASEKLFESCGFIPKYTIYEYAPK